MSTNGNLNSLNNLDEKSKVTGTFGSMIMTGTSLRNDIGNMSQGNLRQSNDTVLEIDSVEGYSQQRMQTTPEVAEHSMNNWCDRRPSHGTTSRVSQSQKNLISLISEARNEFDRQQQRQQHPQTSLSTFGHLEDQQQQLQQHQHQHQSTGNRFLHSNSDSIFAVSRRGTNATGATTSLPTTGIANRNATNTGINGAVSGNGNGNGGGIGSSSSIRNRNTRSWRMNLNNILSIPPVLSSEAIRTFITGNLRYNLVNQNNNSNNNNNATTATTATTAASGTTASTTTMTSTSGHHIMAIRNNNSSVVQSPTGSGSGSGSNRDMHGFRLNIGRLPILRQNSLPLERVPNVPNINNRNNSNNNVAVVGNLSGIEQNDDEAIASPSASSTVAFPIAASVGSRPPSTLPVTVGDSGRPETISSNEVVAGDTASLTGNTMIGALSPTEDENNNDHNPDANNPTGPDDLNNDIPEFIANFMAGFVCYIPTICTVLTKYFYDHFWGILDIILLQTIMYSINNSLRREAMKHSHKSYAILIRDYSVLLCVVMYRLMITDAPPDPLGLIIMPSHDFLKSASTEKLPTTLSASATSTFTATSATESLSTSVPVKFDVINSSASSSGAASDIARTVTSTEKNFRVDGGSESEMHGIPEALLVTSASVPDENMGFFTKIEGSGRAIHRELAEYSISLEVMLYYVATNDLILKLITQMIKIMVTGVPAVFLGHKNRVSLIFEEQGS